MTVQDLFSDFRDGSRLLDLLEVMCSQRMVSVLPVNVNIKKYQLKPRDYCTNVSFQI